MMNKYQKLMAKVAKYSMQVDIDYGVLDTSFRFNRRCWREEVKDFKDNYSAIKARVEYLKNWHSH